MTDRPNSQPATEKQIAYLATLTAPDRLAAMSKSEANFLIRFHSGAPRNASRAQQLYLYGLLDELEPAQVRALIDRLATRRQLADPPPLPAPEREVAP